MGYDYAQWIAIYGAALSTTLLITKLLENRRMLKVGLSHGVVSWSPESVLMLSCSNIGKRPITLNSYGIKLPNKRFFWFINESPDQLPKTLQDGEGCLLCTNLKQISKDIYKGGFSNTVKLRGFFGDTAGRKYFSKKLKFDPAK